ncbi:aromatic acid exporter family member 1 [Homoserinimonas aerilata]|uniref:Aromatic acid exporter family member 1 n=1 Tax=Homoserinimonas aerilata TaxID=1162970 RepID=A0A542YI90_9MICO|nr:aromatic acid exporter family protein [Homoserinimonas aerilata]TQL47809.1 aromatic acid exporter family member 1 [Homoserinimonas aerilata]
MRRFTFSGAVKTVGHVRSSSRGPLLQVVKTSIAAVLSWLVCNVLLDQPLPIFAAIAALLVVQPSVNQSLAKGLERSLGVILGVVLAYGAGLLFGSSSWIVLAIIVVALLLAWALQLTPGSANQIPISAMLVLAIGGGHNPQYSLERIIETIIGVIVALIVNFAIVPPVLLGPATTAVQRLASRVAATLDGLADALTTPTSGTQLSSMLAHARTLRPLQFSAAESVTRAEESLLLNPRGGRHRQRLARDRELLARLTVLVTRVLGMTRALHDHYDEHLPEEPMARSIATELTRAAHDLRLLAGPPIDKLDAAGKVATITSELPALTAPLVIAVPHPQHWVLIGSLMEDLRRVREEIIGGTTAD